MPIGCRVRRDNTSGKSMRAAWFLIAALCVAPGARAQSAPDTPGLEVSVRYWLSTGNTKSSHDASGLQPLLGNPTSTLTYDNLGAHSVELNARKRFGERWFVKGNVGIGAIPNGRLVDQDFATAQALVFETTSGLSGKLAYGMFDIGREVWKRGNASFGFFVGYHYWNERLDAYGASNSGEPLFVFLDLPGDNVPLISNQQIWDSLRIGAEMRSQRGRTRLQAELALIPYARYRNEDSHWLRQATLGPAPNIIATGRGTGAQLELDLRRSYPEYFGLELGVGYRYWRLSSNDGTTTFGGHSFPVTQLVSERQGVMFTVSKSW
jgi:hypothetical protein